MLDLELTKNIISVAKKVFNLDIEKIVYALGNTELCFWQGKIAENVVFLFMTLGRAAFIWL